MLLQVEMPRSHFTPAQLTPMRASPGLAKLLKEAQR
jgi:hypothetical protein